jgi:signal transduction histidine kinase
VRPTRLLRTTNFRLALIYAGLFGVSAGLLFVIIYWIATSALSDQARASVQARSAAVADVARARPADLAGDISRRIQVEGPASLYLLEDAAGSKLAGNLPALPVFEGWRDLPAPPGSAEEGDAENTVMALGRRLADGRFLVVGADTARVSDAKEAMTGAATWAIGAMLVLALAGGLVVSRAFLARIDAINRTTRAIMAGDLSQRIATRATGDELDQLAGNLNEMLDRLQHVMEGLRQVSSDIAHDLRTPLSRLKLRLEAASSEARSEQDYRAAVEQALQDADAALSIFSALLRIAQIESGTRRAQFTTIDLSALLQNLAQTYTAVAEDLKKRLISRIAPDLRVHGDRELLTQMLVNLLENALHHTPDGATVAIEAGASAGGAVVEIADNGPGIPEMEHAKVFQRFYRLESSRSTPGSGLGLALVAAIADLHGITVTLADNGPGLRVTLRFPKDQGATTRTS